MTLPQTRACGVDLNGISIKAVQPLHAAGDFVSKGIGAPKRHTRMSNLDRQYLAEVHERHVRDFLAQCDVQLMYCIDAMHIPTQHVPTALDTCNVCMKPVSKCTSRDFHILCFKHWTWCISARQTLRYVLPLQWPVKVHRNLPSACPSCTTCASSGSLSMIMPTLLRSSSCRRGPVDVVALQAEARSAIVVGTMSHSDEIAHS